MSEKRLFALFVAIVADNCVRSLRYRHLHPGEFSSHASTGYPITQPNDDPPFQLRRVVRPHFINSSAMKMFYDALTTVCSILLINYASIQLCFLSFERNYTLYRLVIVGLYASFRLIYVATIQHTLNRLVFNLTLTLT